MGATKKKTWCGLLSTPLFDEKDTSMGSIKILHKVHTKICACMGDEKQAPYRSKFGDEIRGAYWRF